MADVELFPCTNTLKQGLYCIVDFKSLTILPPFLANNDDEAVRNFSNLINYANSAICRFPEDFKLYKISEFITTFTGNQDVAKESLEDYVHSKFTFISSADILKAPDTVKFDDLNKKYEEAVQAVQNANKVLLEQIGDVPNLDKQINLIQSKLMALTDEFEHFKTVPELSVKKKKLLDKLFS